MERLEPHPILWLELWLCAMDALLAKVIIADVEILMLKAGSYESRIYVHIVTDFIPHDSN